MGRDSLVRGSRRRQEGTEDQALPGLTLSTFNKQVVRSRSRHLVPTGEKLGHFFPQGSLGISRLWIRPYPAAPLGRADGSRSETVASVLRLALSPINQHLVTSQ